MGRENVLTWLEICGKNNDCSGCCPYSENGFGEYGRCRESLMADAYDLLKEQEAVEPTWSRGKPFCGACGLRIHGGKFCSECGKPILWESRLYCINCGQELNWK